MARAAMSAEASASFDLEALLSDALRPVEPPERLSARLEATLSRLTEAAATELSNWADQMSEDPGDPLREPRNWLRPIAAAGVGGAAGAALLVLEVRRRRRQEGLRKVVGEIRGRLL